MDDYIDMQIELVLARFRPDKVAQLLTVWGSKWPECNDQPPSAQVVEQTCRSLLYQCGADGHIRSRHEIVASYDNGTFVMSCNLQRVTSIVGHEHSCPMHAQEAVSDLTSCLRAIVHQNGGRVVIDPEVMHSVDNRHDLEMRSKKTDEGLVFELVPTGEDDETEHSSGG